MFGICFSHLAGRFFFGKAKTLFFGFLFKDFPSGLVLYWLVQNILTIIQQLIMNKWWKDHPEEIQKA